MTCLSGIKVTTNIPPPSSPAKTNVLPVVGLVLVSLGILGIIISSRKSK